MAMLGDHRLPERAIRAQIASAVQLIVQVARLSDGNRRITCISELTGCPGETLAMNDLFVFEQKGVGQQGRVRGQFRSTGIIPRFSEKLIACGISLPEGMLDHSFDV
jgi:pilus assembly protein CpaF